MILKHGERKREFALPPSIRPNETILPLIGQTNSLSTFCCFKGWHSDNCNSQPGLDCFVWPGLPLRHRAVKIWTGSDVIKGSKDIDRKWGHIGQLSFWKSSMSNTQYFRIPRHWNSTWRVAKSTIQQNTTKSLALDLYNCQGFTCILATAKHPRILHASTLALGFLYYGCGKPMQSCMFKINVWYVVVSKL